jgi:UDP-N-acetylglucosamine 2-epimerase (non-hydrolysing)
MRPSLVNLPAGSRRRVLAVVGARPNFVKVAPVLHALAERGELEIRVLHTGQHYDRALSDSFIEQLGMPAPDHYLGVGSGTHAEQTAAVMVGVERVLSEEPADVLIVPGDVNSTVGAALAASKLGVPIAHVESGLRSGDRTMPEEINRIVTDQIADLLFVTEQDAIRNLEHEGVASDRVRLVGNVMIDSLLEALPRAIAPADTFASRGASAQWRERAARHGHAFLTLHRPSNVDERDTCGRILTAVNKAAELVPIVFALHPRTREAVKRHQLTDLLDHPFILATEPLSYFETVGLLAKARMVLTDSGGLQEETTGLGVPCITLRENTERPVTVDQGTNVIVGMDAARILASVHDILATGGKRGQIPPLWDGKTADRIAAELASWLADRTST